MSTRRYGLRDDQWERIQDLLPGRAGGLSTKIHVVVDALGNPIRLHLTAGQKCELDGADVLLPELKAGTIIADKASMPKPGCSDRSVALACTSIYQRQYV